MDLAGDCFNLINCDSDNYDEDKDNDEDDEV